MKLAQILGTLDGVALRVAGDGLEALALAREGAKLVICARTAERILAAAEEIRTATGVEVLARALVRPPKPIEWDEASAKLAAEAAAGEPAVDEDGSGLTAH